MWKSRLPIVEVDFYLKRGSRAVLPGDAQFMLSHHMHLGGLRLDYSVWLANHGKSVWQSVDRGPTVPPLFGRLLKCTQSLVLPEDFRDLAKVLVRARWPFEVAGELIRPGLITGEVWGTELDDLDAGHEVNARAALEEDKQSPSPTLEVARSLGLAPTPQGEASHQWTARCPRGSSHPILINAATGEWGCPWCRRKGGPKELLKFAAEHQTYPRRERLKQR